MNAKPRRRKKEERKQEDYFMNLVDEGVKPPRSVCGISKDYISEVLRSVSLNTQVIVDVVFGLLDDTFPSLFDDTLSLMDGASTAHLGCYVGIFLRHGRKLDREGRDYWLKPLYESGIVEKITFEPRDKCFYPGHLKAKSPYSAYRLHGNFIKLITSQNKEGLREFFSENAISRRLQLRAEIEAAALRDFGQSDHRKLIGLSIEYYSRIFLPDFEVIYTDETDGDRITEEEQQRLVEFGLSITLEDSFPDVVLVNDKEELWFIEAVTSDGEVDETKVANLKRLCERNGKTFAGATTTYLKWKDLAKRQAAHKNLAVNTFVWVAEDGSKNLFIDTRADRESLPVES